MPPRNSRYPQIAAQLRDRILSGEWPPGSRLPTLDELATEYGANKNTIMRAINDVLEPEGLVSADPRRGIVVQHGLAQPHRPPTEFPEVPSGAILAALTILEATGQGDEEETALDRAGEIAGLVNAWDTPVLIQAFGLLIYSAMAVIHPEEDQPDKLHLIVPAVLTRLAAIDTARPFVPIMAGVLTAAVIGDDPWLWRSSLGPVPRAEVSGWCWTAWLMADLTDSVGLGEPGTFRRIAAEIITSAAAGEDTDELR